MSVLDRDINVTNSAITTIPGTLATVIFFDSTANPVTGVALFQRVTMPSIKRIRLRLFADQAIQVFVDGIGRNSTTWRTVNGGGAGEAALASTLFERDWFLGQEEDFRVRATTPAGAITIWDIAVKLSTDQALGQ